MDDLAVVIVAGGSARRFGGNKLLLELDGLPLFLHCVRRFLPAAAPGCLVVVHPRGGGDEFRLAAERFLPDAPIVWAVHFAALPFRPVWRRFRCARGLLPFTTRRDRWRRFRCWRRWRRRRGGAAARFRASL